MPSSHPTADALRAAFRMRPAPRRWPLATRVAVSTGIPVAIGWLAGDIGAGLIASLGAFTADFGTERPYRNRGRQSAGIAMALAAAVTIGAWAAPIAWVAVAAVTAVAIVAVVMCGALSVGPPGPYIFVLACAAGVGASASHLPPWQVGLLVLAGGAVAWAAHMSGALIDPYGPERRAVAVAGEAVATYLESVATSAAGAEKRRAAEAVSNAWVAVVNHQPGASRTTTELERLRAANHALHVMFADGMVAAGRGEPAPPGVGGLARAIGALAEDPAAVPTCDQPRPPLPAPTLRTRLAGAFRTGSHEGRILARVAVATPLAGAIAALIGIGHAYWAMAAAVLVLHQGSHLTATLQRGAERIIGTLAGLGLAALILMTHPHGLCLVVIVAALQFGIEMFMVRNYAAATVFITAIALTISSGTHRLDVGALILDRGLDTLIGCGAGLAVYLLMVRRQEASRIHRAIAEVLRRTTTVTTFLADGAESSLAGRAARRALQESIFDLYVADDAARHGVRADRAAADRLTAVVTAAVNLGYATVAACWAAEQCGPGIFGSSDVNGYLTTMSALEESFSAGASAPPTIADGDLPHFAANEVIALELAIRQLNPEA